MAENYVKAGVTVLKEIEAKIFVAPQVLRFDVGWVEERKSICVACDKTTWMTKKEYLSWLLANKKDIAEQTGKGLEEILLDLPPLLIQTKDEKRQQQFCSICKCWLPAKMRVKGKECPIGKWPGDLPKNEVKPATSIVSGVNNGAAVVG